MVIKINKGFYNRHIFAGMAGRSAAARFEKLPLNVDQPLDAICNV